MEHRENMGDEGFLLGYFGVLPLELIQEVLCQLDLNDLLSTIVLSSRFHTIFVDAKDIILYNATSNTMGHEIFKAATARYACSVPGLKDSVNIVTKSRANPLAGTIGLSDKTLILDAEKFRLPLSLFTTTVFREIRAYHRSIEGRIQTYGAWQIRQHPTPFVPTPADELRIIVGIYLLEIAKLLFPDDYREHDDDVLIVNYAGSQMDWITYNKGTDDEPIGIRVFQLSEL